MPASDVQKIFVLHVEKTVLYNHSDINSPLLDSLVAAGIQEVCLFTDASLKDVLKYGQQDASLNLVDLVSHLNARGINVKKIMTPADPFLEVGRVGLAYTKFYEPLMNARKAANTPLDLSLCTKETLDFMFAQLAWDMSTYTLSEMIKALKNPRTPLDYKPQLGLCLINKATGKPDPQPRFLHSLQMAKEFFTTEANRALYCLKQQFSDYTFRVMPEHMAAHDKQGIMMQHFMDNMTNNRVKTELYYLDSSQDTIGKVQKLGKHFRHIDIRSCLISREFEQATSPSEKERYLNFLERNRKRERQQKIKADRDTTVSTCFLLRVLAHPITLPAFLIVLGAAGIAVGGIGLISIGISLGLPTFLSQVITGVGAGVALTGLGVGMYRFFSASTEPEKDRLAQAGSGLTQV